MYFTPTTFIAQLLAAMQVLMTLDMPLSTTMALPVTSKPIESTVENMAWQAWIKLPPEQKQQVKSRKVTPKSIFTLPLRVECPEGHKQVDTKCIPIVIGSNDVLIDLNALGLLVGNTHTDDLYDYDDVGDEMGSSLPYGSEMTVGEAEKSYEGITVELKPPSNDEPLKFNIFENKFNIFHEEPLDDYLSFSNEGSQSSEKEQNVTVTITSETRNESSIGMVNVTAINDLISESSNISENNFEIYVQQERNSSSSDSLPNESNTLTTLADDGHFNIDAISVPASGFETQKSNKWSIIQNDSSIQMVTSIMDNEATTTTDDHDKPAESDIQTLLKTESFLPLLNQTTAASIPNQADDDKSSLSTVLFQEPNESSPEALSLNVDEEMTTLPNLMEQEMNAKYKQEHTRSVTLNPLIFNDSDSDVDEINGDNDQVKDTTLEVATNDDEPLETTTPIQLDDTTIIETSSSLSATPSTQNDLQELLLQQEQTQNDFEELQRMRKGQKDQHVVLKKSKVEPVEVLSTKTTTTTAASTSSTATTTKTSTNLPTATKRVNELISSTAETVSPLLTVHNKNDNNDRFYYQHFAKQDSEVPQQTRSDLILTTATAADSVAVTTKTVTETISLTSEIDPAEELRIINELVKGIRPASNFKEITAMQQASTTTTTTTTEKPSISTPKTILFDDIQSSSSDNSLSESYSLPKKPTPSTLQIWAKILPLLTTTTTTQKPKSSTEESFKSSSLSNQEVSNDLQTFSSSPRSNRNSKIIRLNGFNRISAATAKAIEPTISSTTAATTPTSEDSSSTTSSSANLESSTENYTYEPYWWLPVAWRLDKPTSSEKQQEEQNVKTEEQPLLLRFWSTYHAPKSS